MLNFQPSIVSVSSLPTPSVPMSVSVSTPQSNVPSILSDLDTVSSEASETMNRDIDRLLHHIHELDRHRGAESHDIAENVRRIRDELYDLSDFLRQQRDVPHADIPPPVPQKDREVSQDREVPHVDRGVQQDREESRGVPQDRAVPPGRDESRGVLQDSTVPPGRGVPPREVPSGKGILLDREVLTDREVPSDKEVLQDRDFTDRSVGDSNIISQVQSPRGVPTVPPTQVQGPRAMPTVPPRVAPHLVPIPLTPPPVRIPSPSSFTESGSFLSSHHSDDYSLVESESYPAPGSPESIWSSPSEDDSSTTSSGPYMSRTSVSSPPSSPTPSSRSVSTARPPPPSDVTMRNLRDLLNDLRNQTGALWDGQVSTNHMLDDLRGRRAEDHTDLNNRVRNIENMLQQLLDQPLRHRPQAPPGPIESSISTSSDDMSDIDSIRRRWDDLIRSRQQIHMPTPTRAGALDDQLADLLGATPTVAPPVVQPPPVLVPFTYHPAPRASRPRSQSPTLDIPIRPYTAPVRFEPSSRPIRRVSRWRDPRPPPSADWRSDMGVPHSPRATPVDYRMGDPGRRRPGPVPPAEPVVVSSSY